MARGPSRVIAARRRLLAAKKLAETASQRHEAAQLTLAAAESNYRSLMDKRARRDAGRTMEAHDG